MSFENERSADDRVFGVPFGGDTFPSSSAIDTPGEGKTRKERSEKKEKKEKKSKSKDKDKKKKSKSKTKKKSALESQENESPTKGGLDVTPSTHDDLDTMFTDSPVQAASQTESFDDERSNAIAQDDDLMREFQSFAEDTMNGVTTESRSTRILSQMQSVRAPRVGTTAEVPRDLLVDYMLAMGADRRAAEELAANFEAEQLALTKRNSFVDDIDSEDENDEDSVCEPPSDSPTPRETAASRKRREMDRYNQTKPPRNSAANSKLRDLNHHRPRAAGSYTTTGTTTSTMVSASNLVHAPSSPSPYRITASPVAQREISSALAVGAELVEAVTVKEDFADDTTFIYAESTPIKFAHILQERPVKRLILLGCVIMALVVFLSVYFSVFANNDGGSLGGQTASPTASPSFAPTMINQDVVDAAIKLSGEDFLDLSDSPQLRAVGWISTFDKIDTGGYNDKFSQRYAIVTIYYSLAGEDWISQEKWLDPMLHECEWSRGISCDSDASGTQVVVSLDITRNNCRGQLPAEIGLLVNVEVLNLQKNKIGGTIPTSVGLMTSLSTLDLGDNAFQGEIPTTIGGASLISLLDLSSNQLKGTIPVELFDLQLLRTLVLSSNKLSGLVNPAVDRLASLVTFDVRQNMLTGTMPLTVDAIPSLDIVYLDYNQFTGPLPPLTGGVISKQILSLSHNRFTGNFEVDPTFILSPNVSESFKLQYIDVSYNKLSGPINPILGYCPTLKYFDLSGNGFYGTFPSNLAWPLMEYLGLASNSMNGTLPIGQHTYTHLDLGFNQFVDSIPEDYCNYSNLRILILNNNKLVSSIPSCLFSLPNLLTIEFKDNYITGTIPTEIGQINQLERVDLSGNEIGRTLPTELGSLASLKTLILSQNQLTGMIPMEIGSMTKLQTLELDENNLSGVFPSSLGGLSELEGLTLHDNNLQGGEIPQALCTSTALALKAADIGCGISCSCCKDHEGLCGN